jgi:hypothetical protein
MSRNAAEWRDLIGGLAKVRGLAGDHTHVPAEYEFEGRPVFVCPVFVCPALKNNFDLTAKTLLPPGYRTFEFSQAGTVSSELQMVDDERWPRHPIGRSVVATSMMRSRGSSSTRSSNAETLHVLADQAQAAPNRSR